jgi:hypothetical protein
MSERDREEWSVVSICSVFRCSMERYLADRINTPRRKTLEDGYASSMHTSVDMYTPSRCTKKKI